MLVSEPRVDLLGWFGATALATLPGARADLYRFWELRARMTPQEPGLAAGAQAMLTAPVSSAEELYTLAYDLAVLLNRPGQADVMAAHISALRDQAQTGPSWDTPPQDLTQRSVSWWAHHFAQLLVGTGNPDRAQGLTQNLLDTAAQLLSAPAWASSAPASTATLANMLRWLLVQSVLSPQAAASRAWLARYGQIVNFRPPGLTDGLTQPVADLLRTVNDNPKASAGGLLLTVGLVAGAALAVANAPVILGMWAARK